MKERFDPLALELNAFCRAAVTLQGAWPLAGMTRLAATLAGIAHDAPPVTWSAAGERRPVAGGDDEIWLHLRADAAVTLQCQRCLQTFDEPLRVDRRLRFVRGEDEAARLDELSDDDVLALPVRLNLHELVEDELILALPLVPRHASCAAPLPLRDPDDEASQGAEEPHPFAALAALRRRGPGPQ